MDRLPIHELERRCQKPDHRRVGNWMARHVSRPAALRVTWVVAPWGVSAHAATLVAWAAVASAACAFAWGTPTGWLVGAVLLQVWYLLDHVDGQLARLQGTASLDGAQLDYLMHHTVNLLVPLGVGWGLFARSAQPWWFVAGLGWGLALLLIGLQHDARYRSFITRLQRVRGTLEVHGGAAGRPEPQPPLPRTARRLATWTARKLCEIHVIANVLLLAALAQWLLDDRGLCLGRYLLVGLVATAGAVALGTLVQSQRAGTCEEEFAAWYRVPSGRELVCRDGWWCVENPTDAESGGDREDEQGASRESS